MVMIMIKDHQPPKCWSEAQARAASEDHHLVQWLDFPNGNPPYFPLSAVSYL